MMKMIRKCNFKHECDDGFYHCQLAIYTDIGGGGGLIHAKECDGEDKCILYNIYKTLCEVKNYD